MKANKLKGLTKEQLKSKEKTLKILMIISIPLIIVFFYLVFGGYFNFIFLTMAICSLGISAIVYPEWKEKKRVEK